MNGRLNLTSDLPHALAYFDGEGIFESNEQWKQVDPCRTRGQAAAMLGIAIIIPLDHLKKTPAGEKPGK